MSDQDNEYVLEETINGRKCYLSRIEGTAEGIWADKLGWFDNETDELVTEVWISGMNIKLSEGIELEDLEFETIQVIDPLKE